MSKLRIAVFTSSRSDYGLLEPLIKLLAYDAEVELLLLVAGSHLSQRFGFTKSDIEADGYHIAAEFDFLTEPPEADYLTESMGRLQAQIGAWLYRERPDWLVVLGDRFELLSVAAAALVYKVPLAHISGGDITKGAVDNQIRHALTKLAHAHFPANATAHRMLLSLGEEDWRICQSGEPGLDQILTMKYVSKEELFASLQLQNDMPTAIVTFHTETLKDAITPEFVRSALEELMHINGFQLVVTGANFDEGGHAINDMLQVLALKEPHLHFVMNLGQLRYYSMLRYAALMVGNSSSGIVEAQSFNLPVINVGSRQSGRLSNPNVLHVPASIAALREAIPKAISPEFRAAFLNAPNQYGDGHASDRIVTFLKNLPRENLLIKQ